MNKIIKFYTIGGSGMGGPVLNVEFEKFITAQDKEEFIKKYTSGSVDDYFKVYPLNVQGMAAMERHGVCHMTGCDSYYVKFVDSLPDNMFTFEWFNNGKFPNRIYNHRGRV